MGYGQGRWVQMPGCQWGLGGGTRHWDVAGELGQGDELWAERCRKTGLWAWRGGWVLGYGHGGVAGHWTMGLEAELVPGCGWEGEAGC